jgi:hypothetical protein
MVSGTAKESALMKVGPESKTKEMKIILRRPNQKCFILTDLAKRVVCWINVLKSREIN